MRSLSPWILCSCLAAIFSFLKRVLFRKSKKEKLDLPATTRPAPEGQESFKEEEELQNWDTWGDDGGLTSIKVDSLEPQEPDFFQDMTPQFKKAAMIRKKPHRSHDLYAYSSSVSNRLTLGVDDTSLLTSELGNWNDESGAWEEETLDEDLVEEADSVLKEKRDEERRQRAAEQQRKKAEREAHRGMKKDKLAVKKLEDSLEDYNISINNEDLLETINHLDIY